MRQTIDTAALNQPFSRAFEGFGLVLSFGCPWLSAYAGQKPNDLAPPKLYALPGTVLRLNTENHTATIKGEKIPGWMDAMTMDYPVKDAKDWRALRSNEMISATVEVRDTEHAIRDVKPIQRSTETVPK